MTESPGVGLFGFFLMLTTMLLLVTLPTSPEDVECPAGFQAVNLHSQWGVYRWDCERTKR